VGFSRRAAVGASQPGVLLPDDVTEVAPKALKALIAEDEAAEGAPEVKETEGPSALGENAAAETTQSLGDAIVETAASAEDKASDVASAVEDKASEAGDVASAKAGEAGSYVTKSTSQAEDAAVETIQNVGENLFDDVASEDDDTRTCRLKLL
jgi:hypothetical protein